MKKAIYVLGAAALMWSGCADPATATEPDAAEQAKQTFYEAMRSGSAPAVTE